MSQTRPIISGVLEEDLRLQAQIFQQTVSGFLIILDFALGPKRPTLAFLVHLKHGVTTKDWLDRVSSPCSIISWNVSLDNSPNIVRDSSMLKLSLAIGYEAQTTLWDGRPSLSVAAARPPVLLHHKRTVDLILQVDVHHLVLFFLRRSHHQDERGFLDDLSFLLLHP